MKKKKQQQVIEAVPLTVLPPTTPVTTPVPPSHLTASLLFSKDRGTWLSVSPTPVLPQGFIPMWRTALALWHLFLDPFTFKHNLPPASKHFSHQLMTMTWILHQKLPVAKMWLSNILAHFTVDVFLQHPKHG